MDTDETQIFYFAGLFACEPLGAVLILSRRWQMILSVSLGANLWLEYVCEY
jgi:hypothetical protein